MLVSHNSFKGIEAVLQHRIRQRGSLPQPTKTKILRRDIQTDRVRRSAGAGAANEIPGTMQDIIESIKPPAPSSEAAKAAAAAEAATAATTTTTKGDFQPPGSQSFKLYVQEVPQ